MKVAILCGGLGTRIQGLYPNTIKSLISFNNLPFIYHQLALLKKNGLTDVVLCTGHGSDEIENSINKIDVVLKHYAMMNIKISKDGEGRLGTGGAIRKALPLLGNKFLVLYGDSYLDFDYRSTIEKFEASKKLGLMTIHHNKDKYDKSNVHFDGKKIVSYEKNNPFGEYIDYGANFFRADAFRDYGDSFDLTSVLKGLIYENQLDYDIIENRFYEIGSPEGIEEFDKKVRKDNYVFQNVFK